MKKESFNKENPLELFSQLVKVLSKKQTPEMKQIISELKSLSGKAFEELKKEEQELVEANKKSSELIINSILKKSFKEKSSLDIKKTYLSKDKETFSYKELEEELWREKIKEAKKVFKINFDLENNESSKERKSFTIINKIDEDNEHVYQFNCELWIAGGDWEFPVYYFKCQLVDGSIYLEEGEEISFPHSIQSYNNAHFVLIPDNKNGNSTLVESDKKGFLTAAYNSEHSEKDFEKKDPKKAWQWLETYLFNYIKEYVNKL